MASPRTTKPATTGKTAAFCLGSRPIPVAPSQRAASRTRLDIPVEAGDSRHLRFRRCCSRAGARRARRRQRRAVLCHAEVSVKHLRLWISCSRPNACQSAKLDAAKSGSRTAGARSAVADRLASRPTILGSSATPRHQEVCPRVPRRKRLPIPAISPPTSCGSASTIASPSSMRARDTFAIAHATTNASGNRAYQHRWGGGRPVCSVPLVRRAATAAR